MILGTKTSRNNSHCKLNLRMDGANDGTTFTDSSPSGKSVTRYAAVTKTSAKKFGTASGYFINVGDKLTIADSADWIFGTDNFTCEFWWYHTELLGTKFIISQSVDADNRFHIFWTGASQKFGFFVADGGTVKANYLCNNTFTTLNTWTHVVYVRNGTQFKIYINGISQVLTETVAISTNSLPDIATDMWISSYEVNGLNQMIGCLDSLMITKGVAKYTRNFQVPNRAA